ncbi:MAG TPA: MarR family transcriptional regulator, partial [Actinospica sp.]|nr:MarR family transcriptional regulator [Actinospica sp.]
SELGVRLGLTTGSVTAMLDRLERLKLLTRSPHPVDRRKSVVRMTQPAVERCFALIAPHLEEGSKVVRERFSAEQLRLVADFLTVTTEVQARHVERLRAQPGPKAGR